MHPRARAFSHDHHGDMRQWIRRIREGLELLRTAPLKSEELGWGKRGYTTADRASVCNAMSGGSKWPNAANLVADRVAGIPQIDGPLRIQPKLRAISEKSR